MTADPGTGEHHEAHLQQLQQQWPPFCAPLGHAAESTAAREAYQPWQPKVQLA